MDVRTKAMVCILPIIAGVGVIFGLVMPAFDEFSQKAKAVDDKKTEQQDLQTKLAEKDKIQREVKLLNDTIEQLRSAVPKKAQNEILNLDMERMCLDSGMEMISFQDADKDALKRVGLEDDSSGTGNAGTGGFSKGKQAFADRVNKTIAGGATAGAAAGKDGKGKKADTGLAKFTVQVKALGDYQSIEKLVRKIETYKRVVAISELKCWIPKKDERSKEARHELPDDAEPKDDEATMGDWKKLWVSFLITAYYLP